jgi:transcriptional regulator with XRE-family HTH domain
MREVRKDAGLTARALAQLTDQHYTRVSKIENGTQVPTDKDILTWCTTCKAEDQVPDLVATARAVESAYLEYRRQARAGVRRALGPFTM